MSLLFYHNGWKTQVIVPKLYPAHKSSSNCNISRGKISIMSRIRLSRRYSLAAIKMLDGMPRGSSTLWAMRASKGFGSLSHGLDSRPIESACPPFDYSPDHVAIARRIRSAFYERLLSPQEIRVSLQYSPVCLDIEIFSSASGDVGGVFTLPDREDTKLDLDHSVTVYGHNEDGFRVDTGWPDWGNNGRGFIPNEYLERHFLTAFVINRYRLLDNHGLAQISKNKVWIRNHKWFERIDAVASMRGDMRRLFNIEIYTTGGTIAGWAHFAYDSVSKVSEVLDLFVLPEHRRMGLGTHLLQKIQDGARKAAVTGYIASHDLGQREEIVKDFLLANNFIPIIDKSKFRDCRFRIEKLPPA